MHATNNLHLRLRNQAYKFVTTYHSYFEYEFWKVWEILAIICNKEILSITLRAIYVPKTWKTLSPALCVITWMLWVEKTRDDCTITHSANSQLKREMIRHHFHLKFIPAFRSLVLPLQSTCSSRFSHNSQPHNNHSCRLSQTWKLFQSILFYAYYAFALLRRSKKIIFFLTF